MEPAVPMEPAVSASMPSAVPTSGPVPTSMPSAVSTSGPGIIDDTRTPQQGEDREQTNRELLHDLYDPIPAI